MEVNNGGTYTYTPNSQSFTLYTLPTPESKPANPTPLYSITIKAPDTIKKGTTVTFNLANFGYYNVYDCTTWADYYAKDSVASNTLTVRPYGAGYHADSTLTYTPETTKTITVSPYKSGTKGGGSVTYVPETVERKVYQPEVYTASSATEAKGTFLTQPIA